MEITGKCPIGLILEFTNSFKIITKKLQSFLHTGINTKDKSCKFIALTYSYQKNQTAAVVRLLKIIKWQASTPVASRAKCFILEAIGEDPEKREGHFTSFK